MNHHDTECQAPTLPECVCDNIHPHPAAQALLHSEALLAKAADFFRILGDRTRTRIVFALSTGEMCVCDLASLLGMTKSAVSHQLATLREAHFVTCRREGKSVLYSLADAHIEHILHDAFEHVSEPEEEESK